MKVIIIAEEIFSELGSPADLGVNAISCWLRANVGALNNQIFTSYTLSDNGSEISPELGLEEKAIFKKMYAVYWYSQQVRNNLGAAAYSFVSLSQDGDTIQTVNKNELSKSYIQMKRMETEELTSLVSSYKQRSAVPRQVAGDDLVPASAYPYPHCTPRPCN